MTHAVTLEEVQLAFAEAHERGEELKDWIVRYPQFALELAHLEFALRPLSEGDVPTSDDLELAERAMRRAIEEFLKSPSARPFGPGITARAAALSIDRKQLAKTLRLSPSFLYRIDKGFVALESLPRRLRQDLLRLLRWPSAASSRVLVSVGSASSAHFSSKAKPQLNKPQPFREALNLDSSISSEDREWWIALMEREDPGTGQ